MGTTRSTETGVTALFLYHLIQDPGRDIEREAQEIFTEDKLRELSALFVSVVDFMSFIKMREQPEAQEHLLDTIHGLLQSHDEGTALLTEASVDLINSRLTAYSEVFQDTHERSIAKDLAKKYCVLVDEGDDFVLLVVVATAIHKFLMRVSDALTDRPFVVGTEQLEKGLSTMGRAGMPEWPDPTDDDGDALSSESEGEMHVPPSSRPRESLNAPAQKSSGCIVAFAAILAPVVLWIALA